MITTRGTVKIDVEACKGCDLCVAACPPGVLAMTTDRLNARGYRYPELSAGCTGCNRCGQTCPDYVLQVWKFDEPVELAEGPVSDALVHREVEAFRPDLH